MSHIPYTIIRSGTYYYNRRVPPSAVNLYGTFIRQALARDPEVAANYANRLSRVLEGAWSNKNNTAIVDIVGLLRSYQPKSQMFSDFVEEYLALRDINEKPTLVAVKQAISLLGDRDISEYNRDDSKLLIRHLEIRGNKTATIRRRLNSLSAVFNYAYAELDLHKRNPFSRLLIRGEGADEKKRGVFTLQQLQLGYNYSIISDNNIKYLMPILGETGCRLAEVVGLRVEDIDLSNSLIIIRPNTARRLKTKGSQRTLPLIGYAKLAVEKALKVSDGEWLFPRYIKDGKCKADHASAALNKWLKKDFDGLTAHSLRHTFRDRLREVECPTDIIDQLGGWSSNSTEGQGYGMGFSTQILKRWLSKMAL